MSRLTLVARLIFGAWMLISGANYLFFSFWPMPSGHEPLAILLMNALVHSKLINVAMVIQLVCGALIPSGFFVPLALCVVMPISVCALYWSLILDHRLAGSVLSARGPRAQRVLDAGVPRVLQGSASTQRPGCQRDRALVVRSLVGESERPHFAQRVRSRADHTRGRRTCSTASS